MNMNSMIEIQENLESLMRMLKSKTASEVDDVEIPEEMGDLYNKLKASVDQLSLLTRTLSEELGITPEELKMYSSGESKDILPEANYIIKRSNQMKEDLLNTSERLELDIPEVQTGFSSDSKSDARSTPKTRQRTFERRMKGL